jgi:hypothetical protein
MTIAEIKAGDVLQTAHSDDKFRVVKVNRTTIVVAGPNGPPVKAYPDLFVRKA